MHSVRLEPTKLIVIGTRTTYQATVQIQAGYYNGKLRWNILYLPVHRSRSC